MEFREGKQFPQSSGSVEPGLETRPADPGESLSAAAFFPGVPAPRPLSLAVEKPLSEPPSQPLPSLQTARAYRTPVRMMVAARSREPTSPVSVSLVTGDTSARSLGLCHPPKSQARTSSQPVSSQPVSFIPGCILTACIPACILHPSLYPHSPFPTNNGRRIIPYI